MRKNYQLLCSILLFMFFFVYLFLLLNVLIFQRINFDGEQQYIVRSINLIPFNSIRGYLLEYINESSRMAFTNLFWNILMFAPLGLYIPVLKRNRKITIYLFWIFLFSLSAEILQGILAVGASDIDDIILNCLGGLLGLTTYKILLAIVKTENRVRVFTTIISTAVGIPVLYIAISTYLYNR